MSAKGFFIWPLIRWLQRLTANKKVKWVRSKLPIVFIVVFIPTYYLLVTHSKSELWWIVAAYAAVLMLWMFMRK